MKATIKLEYIVKIQRATMRVFEAQDQDFPDNRIVANNERAIQYWLNKITPVIEYQKEIHEVIERNNFNAEDLTYKCKTLYNIGNKNLTKKEVIKLWQKKER